MNIVVDVSVFIDSLFIYDEERSNRARNLFRLIDENSLDIIEPLVFGVAAALSLGRLSGPEGHNL